MKDNVKDMEDLLALDPREFDTRFLLEREILDWFTLCDAYWYHDGDPKKPHAELTSGLCSNGYFNCPKVLKYPNVNEILARQLVKLLRRNLGIWRVDWVIGSPYAAITFSYEVAKALGAVHGFAEKDPADPKGKKMRWKRATIPAGSTVLQIEELITTSGTFREVRRAVKEGNAEPITFLPIIGALIHRPPSLAMEYEVDGEKIRVVSLIEKEVWAIEPSKCPLCKAGSPRFRPKEHWEELTGKI